MKLFKIHLEGTFSPSVLSIQILTKFKQTNFILSPLKSSENQSTDNEKGTWITSWNIAEQIILQYIHQTSLGRTVMSEFWRETIFTRVVGGGCDPPN